jgi:hypothetical protein
MALQKKKPPPVFAGSGFFLSSPQTEGDQIRQPEGLQAGASKPPDPVGIP